MKKLALLAIVGFAATLAGCTAPRHSRSITRYYDAEGNLTQTVVTEHVEQTSPNSKPLMDVLEDQTYQK